MKKTQKNDDDDITNKIAIDILIVDGVCNILSKSNNEIHEKPIAQASEDLSTKSTAKFQSGTDLVDDHAHREKPIEAFSTLIYDTSIKLVISLTYLLRKFREKLRRHIVFTCDIHKLAAGIRKNT